MDDLALEARAQKQRHDYETKNWAQSNNQQQEI
jgi:hypothetical protein